MKKLVLMFVAIAAISFASCNNKKAEAPVNADSDSVALTDSVAGDSVQADSAATVDSAAVAE